MHFISRLRVELQFNSHQCKASPLMYFFTDVVVHFFFFPTDNSAHTMYNPYQTHADAATPVGDNMHNGQRGQQFQPQMNMPQQGENQNFGYPQQNQPPDGQFNQFFNDPTTQMGLKFSQTAFNASQNYMQQNLEQFVSTNDIKYYFKVSNAYVLKKLMLIIFPYKNKGWIRQTKGDPNNNNNSNNVTEVYASPIEDINAPDLYIPTMAFLSYILVWALEEGVKGDFHPEMLGYATTRTLAFYIMDFILLRASFYVLGIGSRNSKMWDLVSYTGYKFVPILLMLLMGIFSNGSVITKYIGLFALVFSHGFFLMRSLRYVVLPGGGYGNGGESRLRIQCLFIYCFVVQGVFMWLLS